MKSIINALILSSALVAGVSQAHAEAVWHFPPKGGAPYVTQSEVARPPAVRQTRRHAKHAPNRAKVACKMNVIC